MLFTTEIVQPTNSIPDLIKIIWSSVHSDMPALSFMQGSEEVRRLSYAQYLDAIERWSSFFLDLEIQPGDRVATLLKNRLEVPIIYLALMSIGAVVVPLNPSYSARELEFVLSDSAAIGVLTDQATLGTSERDFSRCRFVKDIDTVQLDDQYRKPVFAPDKTSPAITLYTSGTTAFPKGVVQMHGNLVANAWSLVKALDIDAPTQLSVMPFYHAHAVGCGMMTCLLTGGHLLVAERMDPLAWPKIIRAFGVTLTSMVPNLLHLLERTSVRAIDVPTLRFIFVSAAPLPTHLAKSFEARSGIRIAHAWGLSEFTNFATCLPVTLEQELREQLMFGEATPCVGSCLDGVDVEVRLADGSAAADGQIGELWVRGPSLTLGYHNNPHATNDAIVDGWLRSGDEGYALARDGKAYFFITDRIKDVIVRSGEKISPLAVEAAIVDKVPKLVNNLVALGFEHAVYGEEVGLVIEEQAAEGLMDELKKAIESMPVRQRPKVVVCGHEIIPRTHTGKIQRRLLKARFVKFASTVEACRVERVQEEANHA
jgi:long-chain acyl-CoA synthetase